MEGAARRAKRLLSHDCKRSLFFAPLLREPPLGKLLSGTKITLDTTRGIALVVEGGCQVTQVQPQWPTPQPGNHARPYKGVFEHVFLLFHKS